MDELNLNGSEVIMDAGCGDGHIAIKLLDEYITSGKVYAVDIYDASIEDMEKYKSENNVDNLILSITPRYHLCISLFVNVSSALNGSSNNAISLENI